MQMTIRLPDECSKSIEQLAKQMNLKKSDIARLAIREFIASHKQKSSTQPYTRVQHLLGIAESEVPDLGTNHRKHVIERIRKQRQ